MHIPKTAGLSLQGLVRRRCKKKGQLILVYTQEEVEKGFVDQPYLQVVMGHFPYGYHRFSGRPAHYHVFLRDPLQQLLSHYYFWREQPERFAFPPSGDGIWDFARSPYGHNLQCRFLAGAEMEAGREELVYQKALAHLGEVRTIGLAEHFDLSLLHLGRALGWTNLYYRPYNRGNLRRQQKELPAKEKQALRQHLHWDYLLYREAQKRFAEQRRGRPDLERALAPFQRKNRWFQRLDPLYTKLKSLGKG